MPPPNATRNIPHVLVPANRRRKSHAEKRVSSDVPGLTTLDAVTLYNEALHILNGRRYGATSRLGRITLRAMYARLKEGFSRDELLWACRGAVMLRRDKTDPGPGDFQGFWSLLYVWARGFEGMMTTATHMMRKAGVPTTEEAQLAADPMTADFVEHPALPTAVPGWGAQKTARQIAAEMERNTHNPPMRTGEDLVGWVEKLQRVQRQDREKIHAAYEAKKARGEV